MTERADHDTGDPSPPGEAGSVLGLDNVRIDLPVAGLGNRALAVLADFLILGLVMIVASILLMGAMAALGTKGWWILGIWMFFLFMINWGFFLVQELAMGGQTLGKRALGLRVVSYDGGRPSTGSLVVRNLFRVLDVLVGVFLMAADPLARRLGDRLAGTLVVHEPTVERRLVVGRVPAAWGAREVALIEALIERSSGLEADRAAALARRALAWIERDDPAVLEAIPDDGDPMRRVRLALRVESL